MDGSEGVGAGGGRGGAVLGVLEGLRVVGELVLEGGEFEGVGARRAGLTGFVTWVHDASEGKYGMLFSGKLSFSVVQRFLNSGQVLPQLA